MRRALQTPWITYAQNYMVNGKWILELCDCYNSMISGARNCTRVQNFSTAEFSSPSSSSSSLASSIILLSRDTRFWRLEEPPVVRRSPIYSFRRVDRRGYLYLSLRKKQENFLSLYFTDSAWNWIKFNLQGEHLPEWQFCSGWMIWNQI